MNKITISDFREIEEILDCIHDRWFNKEDIFFNPQLSYLEIRFQKENLSSKKLVKRILFLKKYKVQIVESKLRINSVVNYKIEDKANIGGSDFNEIKYDKEKNRVIITCGVPFEIQIDVENFRIELEDTGNILKEKEYWSL